MHGVMKVGRKAPIFLVGWVMLIMVIPGSGCRGPGAKYRSISHPVRVFIVAGQSNAVGYNHIRDYRGGREPFPENLRVQSHILFWPGLDPLPAAGSNSWTTLRVPESGAFGPEIKFAHDLQQAMTSDRIAIIKYAVGGSGIARSADYHDYIPALARYNDQGRNWHGPSEGRPAGILYQALIENVRRALSVLDREGTKWELVGAVWMQGEHEGGISRKMAEDYASLLTDFIKAVRQDLGAPGLPFVIGQVNSHSWAFGDIVRQSQAQACRLSARTVLVETVDLPRNQGEGGPAHFDADGMLLLGSRFAAAMTPLLK